MATICKAGKRSGLAASILQREGFEGVIHVSRGNAATLGPTGLKPNYVYGLSPVGGFSSPGGDGR